MTAGFFRCFDDLFHRCIRLTEADVVGNGILEQIHALEYKAEIFHQAVHAVILHIHATQADTASVHFPEPGDELTKGGLAATGRADDGGGGFLRNMDGYAIDDFALAVGKLHIFHINIVVGGRNVLPINVHRRHIQNGLRLAHIQVNISQQCRVAACTVQRTEQDKGGNNHDHGIQQLHCAVQIKRNGYARNDHADELGCQTLQEHEGDKGDLQFYVCRCVFVDGTIQSLALFSGQIVRLDFRNALNVLQYLFHQLAVRGILGRRNFLCFLLQK